MNKCNKKTNESVGSHIRLRHYRKQLPFARFLYRFESAYPGIKAVHHFLLYQRIIVSNKITKTNSICEEMEFTYL
jgi:hypothetical protein